MSPQARSPGLDILAESIAQPVIYALPLEEADYCLVLFTSEVARLLRVSPDVVYTLIRSGQLRARNLHPGSRNSRYLIPVGSLREYLDGRDDPIPSAE